MTPFLIEDHFFQALLVISMLSAGLSTPSHELGQGIRRTNVLIPLIFVNFVVIPLAAAFAARALGLSAPARAALILVAACPGGMLAPSLTNLANAETGSSIAFTVPMGLLAVFSAPITLRLLLPSSVSIDGAALTEPALIAIGLFAVFPLLLGLFIRHWMEPLGKTLAGPATVLAGAGAGFACLALIMLDGERLLKLGWPTVGAFVGLAIFSWLSGMWAGGPRFVGEAAAQSSSQRAVLIPLFLAANHSYNPEVRAGIIGYALISLALGLASAARFRNSNP